MYSVYTGYNCSSSVKFIPFGFQESASVCVLVKHNEWYWGDSLEETQNGNWQIELRFMWPGTATSTHGAELRTIRSFRDLSVHSVNVVARFMKQYDPLNGYAGSKLKASIWYFNHYTGYLIWNPVLSAGQTLLSICFIYSILHFYKLYYFYFSSWRNVIYFLFFYFLGWCTAKVNTPINPALCPDTVFVPQQCQDETQSVFRCEGQTAWSVLGSQC